MSAFLLWSRRDEFRRRTPRPALLSAIPVVALAVAMLVLGQLGAIQVVQQVAFIVAIGGAILFVFGLDYLVIAAPAIAYLLFMVPLWDAFTEPLHWPFQNNSARLGVALMHAIGIPVHRDGTFIALPNVLIEVARECSGINYLVAVFALALPLSILRLQGTWRRVSLMSGAMISRQWRPGRPDWHPRLLRSRHPAARAISHSQRRVRLDGWFHCVVCGLKSPSKRPTRGSSRRSHAGKVRP
jgi:exosortase